jgi:hypothetical protein
VDPGTYILKPELPVKASVLDGLDENPGTPYLFLIDKKTGKALGPKID